MKKLFQMFRRIDAVSNNGGEIYIRCGGMFGKQACSSLQDMGVKVNAFLDNKYAEIQEINGIPVLSPDVAFEKKENDKFIVIAVDDDKIYNDIVDEYLRNGLKKGLDFGDYSAKACERMQDFMDIYHDKDIKTKFEEIAVKRLQEMKEIDSSFATELPNEYNLIPNLDVVLTTYCSLSCECCSHCIPYANPPKHYESKNIIKSLDKLLEVSYVACIGIMGGEPFVYPKLAEFFREYKKMKNLNNIGFTRVITNGTVVPSDDFFIEYKDVPNAYVYISNYGKKSNKLNEIVEKCAAYGIKTYICPETEDWLSLGAVNYKRNYTVEEIKHLYAVCESHSCVQLINGRVYACGRVPILNEYNIIPFSKEDYCDVDRSNENLKQELHKYLFEKDYLNGCYYCDGQHMFSRRIKRGL